MNIGRICIRIKSNDLIKFLMGQFDLIMGRIAIQYYYMENNLWKLLWNFEHNPMAE
jgi:hypothetical protein